LVSPREPNVIDIYSIRGSVLIKHSSSIQLMDIQYENEYDLASEYITELKFLFKELRTSQNEFEICFLQQLLDEEALYVKEIPNVIYYAYL